MKTQALYLTDSYQKEMDAQILETVSEGNNRYRLLLDKTVFYPMGGGQPTDQGNLTSPSWNAEVYQVLTKEGEIWHFVTSDTAPAPHLTVHGSINWERRYKNMRVHSGGHIVDFAFFSLGYSPKTLMPQKGDHGKKPYILYQGILGKNIKNELEEKSNELIQKDLKFTTFFKPFGELQKDVIYLQPNLPTDKPLRSLTLENIGTVADGGTQVHTSREVGKVQISAISEKDVTTTIEYRVI